MPSTSAHNNARLVLFHTAAIADGTFTPATLLGPLANGSDLAPPESQYDAYQGGDAEAGATINNTFRIVGIPDLAALQTAKDANPPTELYFFVTNHGGTGYTQIGPVNVKQAVRLGMSMDPRKASTQVMVGGKHDTAEDLYKTYDVAVTMPA